MHRLQELLELSTWWSALDDQQRKHVECGIIVRRVGTDGYVCQRGETVTAWVGVIDGLVKVSNSDATGKSTTLAGVPSGGWFGEGSLLKDEPRRYDAIALRDSTVAYMPRDTFLWLLDISIPFNRMLIAQLNERLAQFIATLEHQRLLTPEARVARCLAQLFNPVLYPRRDSKVAISQTELGLLTGLSRQRANQALRTLEAAGLLKAEYGCVTVGSLERLADWDG